MSQTVTITLPDAAIGPLRRLARRMRRPIEEMLADSIGGWAEGLPAEDAPDGASFWSGLTVQELAKRQGVGPVHDLGALEASFWPDEESVDDLIRAVSEWRAEDDTSR